MMRLYSTFVTLLILELPKPYNLKNELSSRI